ncbi:MAG: S-adenosylmethionine:tRNA ribosyltransferase-isomerase [Chitinophagaceae bacterium]|nr:S-adenosylmethionine:tRNA ribosyltransferase-isomerase [Chitinophagaceae bacterium]
MDPRTISVAECSYNLPENRIAAYPTEQRDGSRLLISRNGKITEDVFNHISNYLPSPSLIIFNNTKVVEARLIFHKSTGARIEIFCLEPDTRYGDITTALAQHREVFWKCLVGNASSWTKGLILEKQINEDTVLKAELIEKESEHFIIKLSWTPAELSFAEILHVAGLIPLPPYIKRNTEITDTERYQTVYAYEPGSVAAPTAGLHFTENIISELINKNIQKDFVTLHVGAGTFKPVKTETMNDHEMHAEFIEIKKSLIENILNNLNNPIIAVGTTSLRTLESIYWLGNKVAENKNISIEELIVDQWDPYSNTTLSSLQSSLESLVKWMDKNSMDILITKTSLLIAPSYEFKIVNTLVTNFHQPRSTLLLLVAAFIGPKWKEIYNYALENNFRFLSYGDACLLFRQ